MAAGARPVPPPPPLDPRLRRPWRLATPALMIAITTATHWPQLAFGPEVAASDKTLHIVAYGTLTALAWRTGWFRTPWFAALATLLWSIVDEVTQAIPGLGRESGWTDVVANAFGCALAAAWIVALGPVGGTAARWRHAVLVATLSRVFCRWWPWLLSVMLFGVVALTYVGLRAVDITAGERFGLDVVVTERWLLNGTIILVLHIAVLLVLRAWGSAMESARTRGICTACGASVNPEAHGHSDDDTPAGDAPALTSEIQSCASCNAAIWPTAASILAPPRLVATLRAATGAITLAVILAVAGVAILIGGPLLMRALVGTWLEPVTTTVTQVLQQVPPNLERSFDVFITAMVFALLLRIVRRRLAGHYDRPTECRTCGHDLRATGAPGGIGRCTECGEVFVRLEAASERPA